MTAAEMPAAPEPSDRESGTNGEMKRKAYQQRQHQGRSEADYAMSENRNKSAETLDAKKAASLDRKSSQQSRSTGIIGMITGAVDLIYTGKARQKEERNAEKQRRPPIPKSHELTENLHDQAKHEVKGPREQAPRSQAKEKQVSDGSLGSKRTLEEQAQQEIAKLREELHKLQAQTKRDAHDLREMSIHAENMENVVRTLRDDSKKANSREAALRKTVAENEAIITQANATAVSRLASNVSREFTDDMIREALKKFFQTEFFSWCADVCADSIKQENAALYKLLDAGIINTSCNYLNGPEYLRFKMNTPDGSGPLVLLQAALATRLCNLYLNDAYFLAQKLMNSQGRWVMSQFERHLSHAQLDAATNWRVETVECLAKAVPITEDYVLREVDSFVQEYGFLLSNDQFDNEARKDLVRIFANFANLALQLWRSRANVQWCGMRGFDGVCFDTGNPSVEVDSSLVSTMGQRLNGRPIGLIIRPAIWSNSMSKNGTMEQVIWLKAHAWVSGAEDPMDLMSLI